MVTAFRSKADLASYKAIISKYEKIVENLNEESKSAENDESVSIALVKRREGLLGVLNSFYKEMSNINEETLNKNKNSIVSKTDELRDVILPKFGIKIEDQALGNQQSFWKLHTIEELKSAAILIEKQKRMKETNSIRKRINFLTKSINDWEKKKLTPKEYLQTLKNDSGKPMYTKFNENGEATHDADGNEITNKGAKKRAKKV